MSRTATSSTWLLTGGAGYIGSHVLRALLATGCDVVVLDDLSTGHRERVPAEVPLVVGSVLDVDLLRSTMREHVVTGVVHLAGKKSVAESVADPLHYYRENVGGTLALVGAMTAEGVDRLVFSSSAAVYGTPDDDGVDESAPTRPESPYGRTKLVGEWMIGDLARETGLRHLCLRYFNVVGSAGPDLADRGGTNLFPLVLRALAAGQRPVVFGDDYPTRDGSCVRDYIHVEDLAAAHVAAATFLETSDGPVGESVNIGCGVGHSVLEVLAQIGATTGLDTTPVVLPRRPGDPADMVADPGLARRLLGWSSTRDLAAMVDSAWRAGADAQVSGAGVLAPVPA